METQLMIIPKSNDAKTELTRKFCNKPPSIIPNVKYSAGNRRLTIELWRHLCVAMNNDKNVQEVAERFIIRHKNKVEEIQWIARHFSHIMGIWYPVLSDEFWEVHLNLVKEKNNTLN